MHTLRHSASPLLRSEPSALTYAHMPDLTILACPAACSPGERMHCCSLPSHSMHACTHARRHRTPGDLSH